MVQDDKMPTKIRILLLGDSTLIGSVPREMIPTADTLEEIVRKLLEAEADLPRSGQVTALTMIELRNRWAAQGIPRPGQNALAVGNHVLRRLAGWVKLRRAGGGGSA